MRIVRVPFTFSGDGSNLAGPITQYASYKFLAPKPRGRVVRTVAYLEALADAEVYLFLEHTGSTTPDRDQVLVYFHCPPSSVPPEFDPKMWHWYLPFPTPTFPDTTIAHRAGCALAWNLDKPVRSMRCACSAAGEWHVTGTLMCEVDEDEECEGDEDEAGDSR